MSDQPVKAKKRSSIPIAAHLARELPPDIMGRNPKPWDMPENCKDKDIAVGKARNLDCKNYDYCLDIACRENWYGFSCLGCEAHEPDLLQIRSSAHRNVSLAKELS